MADRDKALRDMMLFRLDAASSYAEEIGDVRVQDLIDRTRREIEQVRRIETQE